MIKINTETLNVGLLKEILNNYPNNKPIIFEYQNGECPTNVIIDICKYDEAKSLRFNMVDEEE